jgi:monofunctional biosynthetic peptidoglycan transglycosylase
VGLEVLGVSRRLLFRRIGIVALCAVAIVVLSVFLTWLTLPSAEALTSVSPSTTAFIDRYRDRFQVDPTLPQLRWRWVDYDRISVHMKRSAVVAEDIEFFSHSGFSRSEIGTAIRDAIRELESPRGASTITQQTAKNLWLTPSRNPIRKAKEVLLTRRLERALTKSRILEIYLNVAEFGVGIYGVAAAAEHYFQKPASTLTELESAQLAACLPRPSHWNPDSDSPYYRSYVEEIERRLARAEFLWAHVAPSRP